MQDIRGGGASEAAEEDASAAEEQPAVDEEGEPQSGEGASESSQ